MHTNLKRGFTLLELLIVISIIAILSVILVIVLNPAETLKKARDVQRFSDLASLKTALGIYVTSTASPDLDDAVANFCLGETDNTAAAVSYSEPITDVDCSAAVHPTEGTDVTAGSEFASGDYCRYVASGTHVLIDGTGWVPVDLAGLTGGSPISNLPVDPTNTVATDTAPINTDLVYRYVCQNTSTSPAPNFVFEFNATLESNEYAGAAATGRDYTDGGDHDTLYEVGTSLRLLGGSNTH